jgi:hypothetical protein
MIYSLQFLTHDRIMLVFQPNPAQKHLSRHPKPKNAFVWNFSTSMMKTAHLKRFPIPLGVRQLI